jgi:hypothetical protein
LNRNATLVAKRGLKSQGVLDDGVGISNSKVVRNPKKKPMGLDETIHPSMASGCFFLSLTPHTTDFEE